MMRSLAPGVLPGYATEKAPVAVAGPAAEVPIQRVQAEVRTS